MKSRFYLRYLFYKRFAVLRPLMSQLNVLPGLTYILVEEEQRWLFSNYKECKFSGRLMVDLHQKSFEIHSRKIFVGFCGRISESTPRTPKHVPRSFDIVVSYCVIYYISIFLGEKRPRPYPVHPLKCTFYARISLKIIKRIRFEIPSLQTVIKL